MDYMLSCISNGKRSDLFKHPAIDNTFYDEGIAIADSIGVANTNCKLRINGGKVLMTRAKVAKGKEWIHSYANKIEVISNDAANYNIIEDVVANIASSFLSNRKLFKSRKSKPPKPKLSWKSGRGGEIIITVINGKNYNPMHTHFIILEKSMNAKVSIVNEEVIIEMKKMGNVRFKSVNAKGKNTTIKGTGRGEDMEVYAYSQNGNNSLSDLSAKLSIEG